MRTYYYILLLCCGLYSCTKAPTTDYEEVKDKNTGAVTATINGQPWSSNFSSYASNKKDGFSVSSHLHIDGYIQQSLGLENIKSIVGSKQKLHYLLDDRGYSRNDLQDSTFVSFSTSDGDVSEAFYWVLANSDSYLVVDKYDATNQRLAGHFQATLFTKQVSTQGYADTLIITNGYFDVGVVKE